MKKLLILLNLINITHTTNTIEKLVENKIPTNYNLNHELKLDTINSTNTMTFHSYLFYSYWYFGVYSLIALISGLGLRYMAKCSTNKINIKLIIKLLEILKLSIKHFEYTLIIFGIIVILYFVIGKILKKIFFRSVTFTKITCTINSIFLGIFTSLTCYLYNNKIIKDAFVLVALLLFLTTAIGFIFQKYTPYIQSIITYLSIINGLLSIGYLIYLFKSGKINYLSSITTILSTITNIFMLICFYNSCQKQYNAYKDDSTLLKISIYENGFLLLHEVIQLLLNILEILHSQKKKNRKF